MTGNKQDSQTTPEMALMDKIFATLAAHDALLKAMIRGADDDYRRRVAEEFDVVAESMREALMEKGNAPAGFVSQYDRLMALARESINS